MTFVHFKNPTGTVVAIKSDQIVSLREPLPKEFPPSASTVIVLTNGFQAVKETLAEVEAKLSCRS